MSDHAVELLLGIIGSIFSYLAGHRNGRKVHRSGDYIHYKVPLEEKEE